MALDVESLRPSSLGDDLVDSLPRIDHHFGSREPDIIDIRAGGESIDLADAIRSGLRVHDENGQRSLPSLLLWDEQGLRYFEDVTYASEYYLTNTEIDLLERHSHELAHSILPGTMLVELGSGCLRKIGILLQAIEDLGIEIDYYALDLDRNELVRTLNDLRPNRFQHVRCHGLLGTYDDGQAWIAHGHNLERPKCILSLGSTMGSFCRDEAAQFWRQWAETLHHQPAEAKILIGLDGCKIDKKVFSAYNDDAGANRRFILNTLNNANVHLGYDAFAPADWTVMGKWDA